MHLNPPKQTTATFRVVWRPRRRFWSNRWQFRKFRTRIKQCHHCQVEEDLFLNRGGVKREKISGVLPGRRSGH